MVKNSDHSELKEATNWGQGLSQLALIEKCIKWLIGTGNFFFTQKLWFFLVFSCFLTIKTKKIKKGAKGGRENIIKGVGNM